MSDDGFLVDLMMFLNATDDFFSLSDDGFLSLSDDVFLNVSDDVCLSYLMIDLLTNTSLSTNLSIYVFIISLKSTVMAGQKKDKSRSNKSIVY